jgi:thiosulfate/3-mercaptopyruvate sulfurtransferase
MLDPIVTADWLAGHLEHVVVCDVRTTMATATPHGEYLTRHLPGALYVDLDADLADPPAPVLGRHPLPSAERFAGVLARLGIADDTKVVAYDVGPGGHASRLVWMLRAIGIDAGLLSGGLAGWTGPAESGEVLAAPVDRAPVPWPAGAIADADETAALLAAGGVVIDSREAPRYRGEIEPIDAVAGHVPGAINLPFAGNLVDGEFRPSGELTERFAGVASEPDAIVYCGSGVTACHNALAMEAAGLPRPRVYVGSWSGWSTDPDRPVATGAG